MLKKSDYTFQGSIYCMGGRYYWKVKMPGEKKRKTIALKKPGEKATRVESVAYELAQRMWDKALAKCQGFRGIESVRELIQAYRAYNRMHYPETSDMPSRIDYALDLIDRLGDPVDSFGPLRLREVREKMIGKSLSVTIVNERTQFIRKMFDWAAGREIVGPEIPYALSKVENMTGRDPGVEPESEQQPVPVEIVRKTLPELTPTLQAMVKVQLYGGMRPTETCVMRPMDIDTSGDVWIYRPESHKNFWRSGKKKKYKREIALGEKVQFILIPLMVKCGQTDYIFRPEDSEAESRMRKAQNRKTPRRGDTGKKEQGQKTRRFSGRFNHSSYRRGIDRACKRVFGEKYLDCKWTPYQLRHTAATLIREKLGDEGLTASQVFLGQRSIDVAELYAKANKKLVNVAVDSLNSLEL